MRSGPVRPHGEMHFGSRDDADLARRLRGSAQLNARAYLAGLVGEELRTVSGRPNRILALEGDDVVVATGRSPNGSPIPISWVQNAIDQLERDGEITIDVETVGYRSAFIGAVLLTFPGATLQRSAPPRIRLQGVHG